MNKENIKRVLEWLRFKNVKLDPWAEDIQPYDVETFKQCLRDSVEVSSSDDDNEQLRMAIKVLED